MLKPRRPQEFTPQETQYLIDLGAHIRALRQERQLGLEELADQAGIHRTHLWKIEKGQLNAGIVNYLRLANQLGLTPSALFPDLSPDSTDLQGIPARLEDNP